MARYIDAVQCAETIEAKLNIPLGDLVDVFADVPTADVVEVKHGRWEKVINHKECSNCRYKAPYKKIKAGYHLLDLTNYCPNCGAKMDGKEGEGAK